jgi:hypothetical protein
MDVEKQIDNEISLSEYLWQIKLPNRVYNWIDKNHRGLIILYDSCKEDMARMGFPLLDDITFMTFALMMARITHAIPRLHPPPIPRSPEHRVKPLEKDDKKSNTPPI